MIDRLVVRGGLARDEEDYLDVLSDLVEKFEDRRYPIPANLRPRRPAPPDRVERQDKGGRRG